MLRAVALLVSLSLSAPVLLASPAPVERVRGKESYSGFDVERLAEANARLSVFRAQYGEAKGNEAFAAWLRTNGLTRNGYDGAWSAWWERFRADPTGQLQARFSRINSEWSQQLNTADAKDRRLETREGVTLETYARVAVAMTRVPGARLPDVLRRNGIKDEARWHRADAAWAKAMKDDTTFALVQQYGALYQKFAGPQFIAEQNAVTANALAGETKPAAETAAPSAGSPLAAPPLAEVASQMKRTMGNERYQAARRYAIGCELWAGPGRSDPKDPKAGVCAPEVLRRDFAPVVLESLDRADDESLGFAAGLLDELCALHLKSEEARLTTMRALNRAKARQEVLENSFAPIRDKAVPERVFLRAKLDAVTAAVKQLHSTLAAW